MLDAYSDRGRTCKCLVQIAFLSGEQVDGFRLRNAVVLLAFLMMASM